jgi:putative Holliday junction resolvase
MTINDDISKTADQNSKISATGRILALDLGKKRIGVAVCDELRMTVRGVCLITQHDDKKLFAEIEKLAKQFDAVGLVIGLPLNFDGTESSSSTKTRQFALKLAEIVSIPIILQDERLTSREAEEILYEQGYNRQQIKKLVDMEAAAIILRDYLAI